MRRYLQARPGGVLAWLCVSPPSLERRFFEHLLVAPEAVELNVPVLAQAFRMPVALMARVLFTLNRHASIAVQEAPAPPPIPDSGAARRGLAGLEQDLIDICQARGQMLLASEEGLCMAQAGFSPERAQQLAAQLPVEPVQPVPQGPQGLAQDFRTALCFGQRTLHFHASSGVNLRHPLMLRLGVHLLQGCAVPSTSTGR